jgi:hypothetical protein
MGGTKSETLKSGDSNRKHKMERLFDQFVEYMR